ncbi:hypothetical protein N9L33_03455 [Nitrospinae bacterium]|nr:hypothetical protein [Nitrospinota bacterium]|tara:strand:- start:3991 stop:4374 length:384 start_codon:yes stop_codon:yes gene_type:complete
MITFSQFMEHLSDPSLAFNERFTNKIEILRLKNDKGWTVAHAQSRRGWVTEDKDILKWSTVHGYTVAHCQAFHGNVFTSKIINKLSTNAGWLPASKKASNHTTITVEQLGNLVTKGYSYISKSRSKK